MLSRARTTRLPLGAGRGISTSLAHRWFPHARDGDLHVYDFECWWAHLRTTVALRLDAFFLAQRARAKKLGSPPSSPMRAAGPT